MTIAIPAKPAATPPAKAATDDIFLVGKGVDEVACDGGGGPLGHPKVYYSLDGKNQVECLYCNRIFARETA